MKLLALDIGGSSVKYGLVDPLGNVTGSGSFPTPPTLEQLLRNIVLVYTELGAEAVAVSSPGAVDSTTGFVHGVSAVPYLHGPNIRELIRNTIHAPVEIENDANCAGIAELELGEAADISDCVVIVIGTGIGGTVIKNRSIHRGAHNSAGEFGLIITDGNPDTGERHVWSYYSTVKTIRHAEEEAGMAPGTLSGETLFSGAGTNRIFAKHTGRFYTAAAVGILTLQQIYDPERILIGGGISARPELISQMYRYIDEVIGPWHTAFIRPDLQTCRFRNHANLVGAACHFRSLHGDLPE